MPCGPLGFAGGTNILYRNRGDGTFDDVSEAVRHRAPARPGVDGVRRQQLAADRLLRHGRGGGRFRQRRLARHLRRLRQRAQPALSQQSRRHVPRDRAFPPAAPSTRTASRSSGMGVGVGDYDGDGWLDIVRTNFSEQVTTLYRNNGGGRSTDASIRAGLGVNRKYRRLRRRLLRLRQRRLEGHLHRQRPRLFAARRPQAAHHLPAAEAALPQSRQRTLRGRVRAGRARPSGAENLGRGCAFGDFDNDGDVDIIVNNLDGPPTLLRNDGGNRQQLDPDQVRRHALEPHRRSARACRSPAATARQIDEVMSGSSYYSQNDLRLHFGLGRPTKADTRRGRVAFRREGDASRPARQSPLRHPGRRRASSAASSSGRATMQRWRLAGRWLMRASLLLVIGGRVRPGRAVHRHHAGVRHRLQARELRHVEQVPARDDGRRRGPARLRQRRPPGHLLHERREDRRSACRPASGPTSPTGDSGTGCIARTTDGTFVDVTEKAGLTGMPQDRYGMGVAVGDYDNDGFADLYVTSYGGNTLYRNNGDGTFTDVTKPAGVAAGGWSASAGFFDYDNDGRLDLFVTRYVDWSFRDNRYCGEKKPGYRAYCHPDNFDGIDQHPLSQQRRRHVHGRVRRRPASPIASGKGLGVAFADYDGDGFIDVYVANDSVQSFLYRNKRQRHVRRGRPARRRRVQRGRQDVRRHGRGLRRLRQRRPSRHHRHRPLERALPAVSPQRRRQLPRRDQHLRRRRRHAAVLRLEHAVLRLRQRRLEGHLRRAGTRDGHHREDRAQPAATCSRRCCCATSPGRFVRVHARRQLSAGLGRPRRRLRRPRQRRRRRHRRQQRRARRPCVLRNDGGNRTELARRSGRSARRRTATASAAA